MSDEYRRAHDAESGQDDYSVYEETPAAPKSRVSRPRRRSSARPRQFIPGKHAPWVEFSCPPKKGMRPLYALSRIFWYPRNVLLYLLRNLFPKAILPFISFILSLAFIAFLVFVILIASYMLLAQRYDITQVLLMPERSLVLDRKGEEIGTLHGENRRRIVSLEKEVPSYFIDALVLQEDRRFFTHSGVDPKGVARAMSQLFKHKRVTQGGSTLTMQLAKNSYYHTERSFHHKFLEIALARRIEATYDKDTILLSYINRIFWGHSFLGLKQAARGYFNKRPIELSIGEAALLAGIVCNPNEFSPHRDLEAAKIQRDKVLKLMADHGKITRNEYNYALSESINLQWPQPQGHDNYALEAIRREVNLILNSLEANELGLVGETMYAGGLTIRTTLDLDLQDATMRAIDRYLSDELEASEGYPHQTRAAYQRLRKNMLDAGGEHAKAVPQPQYIQGASVVIHNKSGALLALVGGRDSIESPLNRALQSRRQVGSLFKPLVYASFFEHGGSPSSMISDNRISPGEIKGAARWSPNNADGRFLGSKPASWGLLKSRNTMSVRVGNRVGLENIVRYATLSGYYLPRKQKLGPTIYLGTWEATPYEVATSYTTFANGGVRPTPYIIESITDSYGREIWRKQSTQTRVFSQRANAQTLDILEQITKPGGTAAATEELGFTAPSAGKTGTTNRYHNAWYCGFSSELTAAVWVGFDKPRTIMDKGYGSKLALPIWVGIMRAAQELHYSAQEIPRTAGILEAGFGVRLCRESGDLAHEGCDHAQTTYYESIKDQNLARQYCNTHYRAAIVEPAQEGYYLEEVIAVPEEEGYTPAID